jgi:hypothetical protein
MKQYLNIFVKFVNIDSYLIYESVKIVEIAYNDNCTTIYNLLYNKVRLLLDFIFNVENPNISMLHNNPERIPFNNILILYLQKLY